MHGRRNENGGNADEPIEGQVKSIRARERSAIGNHQSGEEMVLKRSELRKMLYYYPMNKNQFQKSKNSRYVIMLKKTPISICVMLL
jgi:hypothetical protein